MTLPQATDQFAHVNRINLHYIEYPSDGPTLLLLHGLTANAHAFDGLIAAGLNEQYRIIAPDLRGRGESDHPTFRYSIEDHAKDVLELLDQLQLKTVVLGGHSFGGLLSFYLAATHPERIEKVIILDAAAEMNPKIIEMLGSSFARLGVTYPTWEAYMEHVKHAPYNTFWDDAMFNYYKADVKIAADGSVHPRINLTDIMEISYNVGCLSWPHYIQMIMQPTILLNGVDDYTMGEPLLPDEKAKETVAMMAHATYIPVDGNHHTMLYGPGARQIVAAIRTFVPVNG